MTYFLYIHRSAYLHVSPGEKVGAFVAPKLLVSKPADHMYWCFPKEVRVLIVGISYRQNKHKNVKQKATPLFSCSSSSQLKPSEITNTRLKKHMDNNQHLPKGGCLNPKGWCIGTPYHLFSTQEMVPSISTTTLRSLRAFSFTFFHPEVTSGISVKTKLTVNTTTLFIRWGQTARTPTYFDAYRMNLPKTSNVFAPANRCLEYHSSFLLGKMLAYFQVRCCVIPVSPRTTLPSAAQLFASNDHGLHLPSKFWVLWPLSEDFL